MAYSHSLRNHIQRTPALLYPSIFQVSTHRLGIGECGLLELERKAGGLRTTTPPKGPCRVCAIDDVTVEHIGNGTVGTARGHDFVEQPAPEYR